MRTYELPGNVRVSLGVGPGLPVSSSCEPSQSRECQLPRSSLELGFCILPLQLPLTGFAGKEAVIRVEVGRESLVLEGYKGSEVGSSPGL